MRALRITAALILITLVLMLPLITDATSAASVNDIIANPNQPYQASIWTDKNDYNIGDKISIGFRVTKPAYTYVFTIDVDGAVRMIFPNIYSKENKIKANTTYKLPDSSKYSLTAGGPNGTDQLVLISTPGKLPDTDWMLKSLGEDNFAPQVNIGVTADVFMLEMKSDTISSAFKNSWSSSYMSYTVGGISSIEAPISAKAPQIPLPVQKSGKIFFSSDPSGARLFVNGVDSGITPVSISNLDYGLYEVNMMLMDYYTYSGVVAVKDSNPLIVNALLDRIEGASRANLTGLLVYKQIIISYPDRDNFKEEFAAGGSSGTVTLKSASLLGMLTKITATAVIDENTAVIGTITATGENAADFGRILEFDLNPFKVRVTVLDYSTIKGSLTGTIYLDTVRLLLEVLYAG